MRVFIFTTLFCLVFVFFCIKKRSIALWTADPLLSCQIEDFVDEEKDGFYIKYSVYTQKSKAAGKSLLILPPTGGKNIIDEGYALNFCRAGYKVYILENWLTLTKYELDYKIHQNFQTQTQRAFTKMISLMDGDEVGVLATSAGAINFTVSLGTEEVMKKVKSFFSIVAGAPLCEVIATSEEKGLRGIRNLRFEKTNVKDIGEYTDKICNALTWESAKTLSFDTAHAAIISMNDTTVETEYQLKMADAYKPNPLIKSNLNHFYTVVSSYFLHKKKIMKFFDKTL